MQSKVILAAGLAGLASAYTTPTNATWGALLTPDLTSIVTQNQVTKVTWDPTGHATDGVTVSLVLCHGPSTNCVNAPEAFASGLPAASKEYDWTVPCSITPGTENTDTGYGMLIIVDQTGEFQYSTQFSILADASCSANSAPAPWSPWTANATTSSSWTTSSMVPTTSAIIPSNYTMTHGPPASVTPVSVTQWTSATSTPTYASATYASASPSTFTGAASKIGGSAAALVMAAGAAVLAL